MATCGCGNNSSLETPLIRANPTEGIIVTGTQSNTIITAADAVAWLPYTPTFTNFVPGPDAVIDCAYLRVGASLDLRGVIRFAASSTYTNVAWRVGFPFVFDDGAAGQATHVVWGTFSIFDASTGLWWDGEARIGPGDLSSLAFRVEDDVSGNADLVRQTNPITFATGDEISWRARLEIV